MTRFQESLLIGRPLATRGRFSSSPSPVNCNHVLWSYCISESGLKLYCFTCSDIPSDEEAMQPEQSGGGVAVARTAVPHVRNSLQSKSAAIKTLASGSSSRSLQR